MKCSLCCFYCFVDLHQLKRTYFFGRDRLSSFLATTVQRALNGRPSQFALRGPSRHSTGRAWKIIGTCCPVLSSLSYFFFVFDFSPSEKRSFFCWNQRQGTFPFGVSCHAQTASSSDFDVYDFFLLMNPYGPYLSQYLFFFSRWFFSPRVGVGRDVSEYLWYCILFCCIAAVDRGRPLLRLLSWQLQLEVQFLQ